MSIQSFNSTICLVQAPPICPLSTIPTLYPVWDWTKNEIQAKDWGSFENENYGRFTGLMDYIPTTVELIALPGHRRIDVLTQSQKIVSLSGDSATEFTATIGDKFQISLLGNILEGKDLSLELTYEAMRCSAYLGDIDQLKQQGEVTIYTNGLSFLPSPLSAVGRIDYKVRKEADQTYVEGTVYQSSFFSSFFKPEKKIGDFSIPISGFIQGKPVSTLHGEISILDDLTGNLDCIRYNNKSTCFASIQSTSGLADLNLTRIYDENKKRILTAGQVSSSLLPDKYSWLSEADEYQGFSNEVGGRINATIFSNQDPFAVLSLDAISKKDGSGGKVVGEVNLASGKKYELNSKNEAEKDSIIIKQWSDPSTLEQVISTVKENQFTTTTILKQIIPDVLLTQTNCQQTKDEMPACTTEHILGNLQSDGSIKKTKTDLDPLNKW